MKYSVAAIILYLLTCFPAFLMMGLAYGATAEQLLTELPEYTVFVMISGYGIPLVLLAAIVLTVISKKKEESAYIVAFILSLFVIGFNILMFMFWSRLFFDLIGIS